MSLFIVATPIGNLEDITARALRILREVDLILCEDTRVSRKLLAHFDIKTPTTSFHEYSTPAKLNAMITLLREGKNLALITDAGTPAISDPGSKIVAEVAAQLHDVPIVSIPGVSALTAAVSVAGIPMDAFLFLGFAPHKKGRQTFFNEVMVSSNPVIFYESPHRILKSLQEIVMRDSNRHLVVCRELTKKFEQIYRGLAHEILEQIKTQGPKGEFVVIVASHGSA